MSEDKASNLLDKAVNGFIVGGLSIGMFVFISFSCASQARDTKESDYKTNYVNSCNISFSYDESFAGCSFAYGGKGISNYCNCKFAKDSKIENRRVRCEESKCKVLGVEDK